MLWENKLKHFIDKINKVHPTIKFTAEWSKTSINFLDVTVYLIEELTETNVYVKPTDSHKDYNGGLLLVPNLQLGIAFYLCQNWKKR